MQFNEKMFLETYHSVKDFIDTECYAMFIKDVKNDELMSHIKFCNDVLNLPPVIAYLKYKRTVTESGAAWENLPHEQRKALGACFGFVYQYGEYTGEYTSSKRVWVGDKISGISTASYFIK